MLGIESVVLTLLLTLVALPSAVAQINGATRLPVSSPPSSEILKSESKSLEVKYRGGLMSIRCHNATLREVLSAVSLKTGAEVDLPPQLAGEHITAHLGPASTKDVLEQLLSSSRFDYVLLGSEQTGKISHIVLREPETISSEIDEHQKSASTATGGNELSNDRSQNEEPHIASSEQESTQKEKQANVTSNKKLKSPSVTTQEKFHDR